MIGFVFGLVVVLVLVLPGQERFHVKGAMNVGHESASLPILSQIGARYRSTANPGKRSIFTGSA